MIVQDLVSFFQGFNVRISGQDVGRATFSHRHAMLVDQVSLFSSIIIRFLPFRQRKLKRPLRNMLYNTY
jgi:2-oxoglutarate dehydrogenase complex dehydrogenase (E1) component-like enzyme